MKKITIIFFAAIIIIAMSGCSKNGYLTISTSQEATCTLINQESKLKQDFTYKADDGKVYAITLKTTYDNSTLGIENFKSLTKEQQDIYKSSMLNTLGLTSAENEGLNIYFEFNDQLSVIIDADLNKADEKLLETIGFDFEDSDLIFDTVISDMKKLGANCK